MLEYKVLIYNINQKKTEFYDVIPYFVRQYKAKKPKDIPKTFEEFKAFVTSEGMYMFWARCEWEILVTGFPISDKQTKLDVWKQIEANLDLVTRIVMESVTKKIGSKKTNT